MTACVSNDKDAIKVLSTNSRGKNQMKILKYLCILKNEKDLNEYVRKIKIILLLTTNEL